MRILWLSPFLLHPTTSGGRIRSLGILKELHRRHEIRFVSMQNVGEEEGVAGVREYSASHRLVPHELPERGTAKFLLQLLRNLPSRLPLTVERDVSAPFRTAVNEEIERCWHEVLVCDFVSLAVNVPRLEGAVIFEHNVETQIWERMTCCARSYVERMYLSRQARRMQAFEGDACRRARHVITVSEDDACLLRTRFAVSRVTPIPTGVDLDMYAPPETHPTLADLVFVGSLNWIPNVDGLRWFISAILPHIRSQMPGCTVAIVGRKPGTVVRELVSGQTGITLHGDVGDVRPHYWGAKAAIVPLRMGGGTRLKTYEAMAAGTPLVSTTLGAEGLCVEPGRNILLADDEKKFAECCLRLLADEGRRQEVRSAAMNMVRERFGWAQAATAFEAVLRMAAAT